MAVKGLFQEAFSGDYTIAKGYKLLQGSQRSIFWSMQVWNRGNIPKHSFIFWLAMQKRLLTKDRLLRFLTIADANCGLCNAQIETVQHLFFDCSWSQSCLQEIKSWLGWKAEGKTLDNLVRGLQRSKVSKFKKNVHSISLAALVYMIWLTRNRVVWEKKLIPKGEIVALIKQTVKERVRSLICNNIDTYWLNNL